MGIVRLRNAINTSVLLLVSTSLVLSPIVYAAEAIIPDGTPVYLSTTETVVGKKSQTAVGAFVPARVWRDVIVDGNILIKGGTRATTKVASITGRKVFGIKGKMSIAAVETTTVDGQTVFLTGGYNKEGKSRMGVSLGVGLLLLWPVLFVPGKAAELPAGTVMDSFTSGAMTVNIPGSEKTRATINLNSLMSGFSVEVLYDLLTNEKKPTYFDFLITTDLDAPSEFSIDVINGVEIKPMKLKILSVEVNEEDEEKLIRANVKIKTLAKKLKKGINTFDVAYNEGNERVSEEVILQIEI
jgi:hypothetical protein